MTTILVVEDEAVVATDIAQRLKRGGYDVPAVAATGEVALRTTEELHPDLVLSSHEALVKPTCCRCSCYYVKKTAPSFLEGQALPCGRQQKIRS